jgi:hypothetical protein
MIRTVTAAILLTALAGCCSTCRQKETAHMPGIVVECDRAWLYTMPEHFRVRQINNPLPLRIRLAAGEGPYKVTVEQVGGSGQVDIIPTNDPLVWHLRGGGGSAGDDRDADPRGDVHLAVRVRDRNGELLGSTEVRLTVLLFADFNNDGWMDAKDRLEMNKRLADVPTDVPDEKLDLNGDGQVDPEDKRLMHPLL